MYIGMRKLYKDKLARQLTGRLRRITADPLEVHLDQLEELTGQRYEDGNDRIDLAKNTQQPEVLSLLARDPNVYVRAYVALNPNTPPQALSELARESSVYVRVYVIRNPNTPPQVLSELARDPNRWVKLTVARSRNTPPQALSELARDPDEDVSNSARLELERRGTTE